MTLVIGARASGILFNLLRSLGRQGRFLLPANVCPIVPLVFLKAGRPFDLVDVDATDGAMDRMAAVAQARSGDNPVAGVLFVRTYGAIFDETAFFRSLKDIDPSILVVDDRCAAFPSFGPIESPADVVLYSTGYAKCAELGYGGFALLADGVRYQRHRPEYNESDLRAIESEYKRCVFRRERFAYRDSAWLDTSDGSVQLEEYKVQVERRCQEAACHKKAVNALYRRTLPEHIQFPAEYQDWRFNIRVPDKEPLFKAIFSAGLFASSHYASLGGVFGPMGLPVAEQMHAQVVNLFNDWRFSLAMASRTADIVARHVQSRKVIGAP